MIKLDRVSKVYGHDTVAVEDVSFDVNKGDFVFLVGPSGSGKSTLLRLMSREEVATEGDVWVAGRNVTEMPPSRVPFLRRSLGNIFQDYKLLLNKTVFENVAFPLQGRGVPKAQRMARAKAYLFGGVELRWSCDESLSSDEVPAKAVFHFPGGLKDFLAARIEGEPLLDISPDRPYRFNAQLQAGATRVRTASTTTLSLSLGAAGMR